MQQPLSLINLRTGAGKLTNGAVERLVQTFKKALKKFELPPLKAWQEFLMLYRRTPLPCKYSPSELLMGHQIRAKIDTFMPSQAHILQKRQRVKQQETHKPETMELKTGTPCYARKYSQNTEEEKWVPGVIVKFFGSRSFNVKVISNDKVWRRHL